MDLRVDRQGHVYVLEVNANPDIGPHAGLARMLQAPGMNYDNLRSACRKCGTAVELAETNRQLQNLQSKRVDVDIRSLGTEDRRVLLEITRSPPFFRPDEIEIADEILQGSCAMDRRPLQSVGRRQVENRMAGWSCHGRVPLTDATFDLYWIVVDPHFKTVGVGRQLLAEVERLVHDRRAAGSWQKPRPRQPTLPRANSTCAAATTSSARSTISIAPEMAKSYSPNGLTNQPVRLKIQPQGRSG